MKANFDYSLVDTPTCSDHAPFTLTTPSVYIHHSRNHAHIFIAAPLMSQSAYSRFNNMPKHNRLILFNCISPYHHEQQ